MSKLWLSKDLAFPDSDAATQTFAFIGRKGSGKTYGAGKLVELLIDAGVQVAILDTVGNWHGLRLGKDGKSPGIDIPILGGLRGDIPLEAAGGALIADALVESGRPMIIDISQFSKADRQRFAGALGERLWRLKKAERQPTPIHLVIEESQLIVPENVRGDQAVMVGTYEEIIRLGRNYGIGATMITQRPQSVNKEVLNQTECLLVFQVNGAHERDALKKWIVHQGASVDLLAELPGLAVGECYVWSPQWLRTFKRVHVGEKRTFDSTSTPKVGQGSFRGRDLKPIDLSDLQTKMAATIERAKAEDPRELRKQVAALKAQVATLEKRPAVAAPAPKVERIEVPVLKDAQLDKVTALVLKLAEVVDGLRSDIVKASVKAPAVMTVPIGPRHAKNRQEYTQNYAQRITKPPRQLQPAKPRQQADSGENGDGSGKPQGGLRRMLMALAQRPQGMSARQLGVRAGLSSSSGTFGTYLGAGRSNGWLEGSRDLIGITEAGRVALGDYEPLPTGQALLGYWLASLGGSGAGRMLERLAAAYPNAMSAEQLGEEAGLSAGSGTFGTYLGKLRTLELVSGGRDGLMASQELFE